MEAKAVRNRGGRPPTDPVLAAQALNMGELGYSSTQVSNVLGIPGSTVRDIVRRHGRWGEIAERPVFSALRREQNQVIEAQARRIAALALVQCEDKLPETNAYQACLISSIMIDKSRLLAGEPTEIIGHVSDRRSVESIEALAAALSQVLIARNQTMVPALEIKAEPQSDLK